MSPEMTMPEVIERARQQLAQVTGLKPVTVIGAHKDSEGWHVGIELLEMSRLPPSTDVLGSYEVLLDGQACMVSFDRKRTRLRGEPLHE